MRTFIDGVLRFGIPPKFFLGVIQPSGRGNDQKILTRLEDSFADKDMKDFYGAKTDANDEDFFPYISNPLTCPSFLNK